MYHSYLQLLCSTLLLNLYCLRSVSVLAIIAHTGQILSKSVKLNEIFIRFEIQLQTERGHAPYFILTKLSQQLSS
jgi:hypothetical protein